MAMPLHGYYNESFMDGPYISPPAKCHATAPKDAIIIFGICLPVVCFIGTLLNLAKFVVLTDRRSLPGPIYIYMAALSAAHALTLFFEGMLQIGMHFFSGNFYFEIAFPYFLWPGFNYSLTLSMSIFVTLTIETYLYVRCVSPSSMVLTVDRQNRAYIMVAILVLVVFGFNFPRTFAYTFNWDTGCHEQRWPSGLTDWFSIYNYCRIIIFNIGSLILLLIFHLLLVSFLRRADKAKMLVVGDERRMRDIRRLTAALVCSVVFCIIIETISLCLHPITVAILWKHFLTPAAHQMVLSASRISYAMVALEFLLIFLFSLLFNTNFRRLFVYKFRCFLYRIHMLAAPREESLFTDDEETFK